MFNDYVTIDFSREHFVISNNYVTIDFSREHFAMSTDYVTIDLSMNTLRSARTA